MTNKLQLKSAQLLLIILTGIIGRPLAGQGHSDQPFEKYVRDIMSLSEEELLNYIPIQCPEVAVASPKIGAHMQETRKNWQWDWRKPEQVRCPVSGLVFPNEQYPMNQTVVMWNYIGEKVTLPYYEGKRPRGDLRGNPHPERYFFNAAIDNAKYQWITLQMRELENAYRATHNPAYARRGILVLDAFAHRYSHYLLHRGRGINNYYVSTGGPCMVDGKLKGTPEDDLPYGWTDSRLGKWWADEIEFSFVNMYAAIKDSEVWSAVSREKGYDVRKHVLDNLLRAMVDFIMDISWDRHFSNNLVVFDRIAAVGRAIDEPAYVHLAYYFLSRVIYDYDKHGPHNAGYTFDLHHPEGNQGHYGVVKGIWKVFKAIEGYNDPCGYVDGLTGKHLDNVTLEKDIPLFNAMVYVPEAYALPDGRINPLNDSMGWTGLRRNNMFYGKPLEASRCRLLPGLGHAVLGDGRGPKQTQVQLQFSEQGANHCHLDCLSLVWYAHQHDMSGDIGYQRNKLRNWASSTLSHNTVVVNRTAQQGGDTFGNVQMFVDDLPGLSAIQVDGTKAYAHQDVRLYRRTVVLNTIDPATPYFVDIFEVEGGQVHDYAMHGSVLGDMTGSSSLPLQRMEEQYPLLEKGERWVEPRGMGRFNLYGLFRNVAAGPLARNGFVDMTYKGNPSVGTRIHFLAQPEATLYLGQTPALRNAGHYQDDEVYNWWMPHLIARRKNDNYTKSTFIAVYDLYQDGPKITSINRIPVRGDGLALKIALGVREDVLLFAPEGPTILSAGSITMDGIMGLFVSEGRKTDAYLIGGKQLTDNKITTKAVHDNLSGMILGGQRKYDGDETDAFICDAELPEGNALHGRWMIVTHGEPVKSKLPTMHAYQIDRVENRNGRTIIHLLHDHGLKFTRDGVEELFSKWRSFKGHSRFIIHARATTAEQAVIQPNTGPWDSMKMQRFIPFMDDMEVTLKDKGNGTLHYTLDGSDPDAGSAVYRKPIVLNKSATVKAVVVNPKSSLQPRIAGQKFQRAMEPVPTRNVKPGLRCKDIRKGEVRSQGVADTFAAGSEDERHYSGFIWAPHDGIYTFYAQAPHGCLLTIGNWTVIDSRNQGPYREWECRLALRKGLHPISLINIGSGDTDLSISWSGPGIPKKLIPGNVLLHGD